MPQVRRYGQQQVEARPLPDAYKRDDNAAAAKGIGFADRAVDTLTSGLEQVLARERNAANQIAVLEADNQLSAFEQDRLWNPETGVFTTRKGKDAIGVPLEVLTDLDKVTGQILEGLGTDEAKLAFRRSAASRRLSLSSQLHRYSFTEIEQWDAAEATQYLENAVASAVTNATDLVHVSQQLAQGEAAIKDYAIRNDVGVASAQTTAKLAAFRTQIHAGVMGSLIDQQKPVAAKAYFEELQAAYGDDLGSQLSPEAQSRIRSAIAEGTLREQTQDALAAILTEGGTLTEQRALARARYSGELEDRVVSALEHESVVSERATAQQHTEDMVRYTNILDATKRISNIPPGEWDQLSPSDRTQLRRYVDDLVTGTPRKTDMNVFSRLINMAQSTTKEDVQAFAGYNLFQDVNRLSDGDMRMFLQAQAQARNGDTAALKALNALFTNSARQTDMISEAKIRMGISGTDAQLRGDKPLAARSHLFDLKLRQALDQVRTNEGRQPRDEDVQQAVDRLSLPIGEAKKGGRFSGSRPTYAFEAPGASAAPTHGRDVRLAAETADIPRDILEEIRAALGRAGQDPTEENVQGLYRAWLARQP